MEKSNLIAISGKIGSGKDTVGKIIQYLTHCKNDDTTWENWNNTVYQNFSKWKIKKFAGKLKQIVSILTGIHIEDLEKQEVKDKVLGKEWWRDLEYTKLYSDNPKEKITVRQLLQEIGTDAMRDVIHPNIWVNALFADYKGIPKYAHNFPPEQIYPNWIITDMRFPNELQAVKNKGGISIRVNRPKLSCGGSKFEGTQEEWDELVKRNKEQNAKFNHPSETALDNATFDYVINNNKGISELIEKVKEILIKEKIL